MRCRHPRAACRPTVSTRAPTASPRRPRLVGRAASRGHHATGIGSPRPSAAPGARSRDLPPPLRSTAQDDTAPPRARRPRSTGSPSRRRPQFVTGRAEQALDGGCVPGVVLDERLVARRRPAVNRNPNSEKVARAFRISRRPSSNSPLIARRSPSMSSTAASSTGPCASVLNRRRAIKRPSSTGMVSMMTR